MGLLADIQAISSDSAKLATDQAALTASQAAVTADTAASAAADSQLSTDLQAAGPTFVPNADGTVSVYSFAATPPGYTIVVAKPAT